MRRLFSLCCLLLLLLTLGGRSLFFGLRMAEVRVEMRHALAQGIKPELVRTFSFAKAQSVGLRWIEAGAEFEWQGKRYDVLTCRSDGGCLVVQALSDEQETAIVSAFRQSGKKQGGDPASILLLKLAGLAYIAAAGNPVTSVATVECSCRHEKQQELHPVSWRSHLLEPPATPVSYS